MTKEAELEAKALTDIEKYGCHVIKVFSEKDLPPFAYSIGIKAKSNQPDLMIIGLSLELSHWIINEYNARVIAGESFRPNVCYDGFIDAHPVLFSPMLKDHYPEYLGWGLWYNKGKDFPMYQMIYPDNEGRWFWHPGANSLYKNVMPLLSERPHSASN